MTLFERTARETLDFCLRELAAPDGGFCSSLDADSEGVEGRFYVWTVAALREELGVIAGDAIEYFGASEHGNFEGANVLEAHGRRARGPRGDPRGLLAARERRTRPPLDDKRIASLERTDDRRARGRRDAAARAALPRGGGGHRELRAGSACATGPDACCARSTAVPRGSPPTSRIMPFCWRRFSLYAATFDERWFTWARSLGDELLDRFADPERGGFFVGAADGERLIVRRKDLEDSPIPSGSSSAALGLLRLAALTGDARYEERRARRAAPGTRWRRATRAPSAILLRAGLPHRPGARACDRRRARRRLARGRS